MFRRWWRSVFERQKYKGFKKLYKEIVEGNAATHEVTVVDRRGEIHTLPFVGYSDRHVYLLHCDRTVSYHDLHDVLDVRRIRTDDKEHQEYVSTQAEIRRRLNRHEYYFVRFPGDRKYVEIKSLNEEIRRNRYRCGVGFDTSNNVELIDFYLKFEWDKMWMGYQIYLPEDIEIIADGTPIPKSYEPHDIFK